MADIKWEPRQFGGWGDCWEHYPGGPYGFTLRVSPNRDATLFAAEVINGQCLYRSNRYLPLEEAQQLAIREGVRVARQQAKLHAAIAEYLAKHRRAIGDVREPGKRVK